jgi:hypothetical protein
MESERRERKRLRRNDQDEGYDDNSYVSITKAVVTLAPKVEAKKPDFYGSMAESMFGSAKAPKGVMMH